MYMRNNNYNKYAKYSMDGLPPNYSGQYTKESLRSDNYNDYNANYNISENEKNIKSPDYPIHNSPRQHKEVPETIEKKEEHREIELEREEPREKRGGSLFGNLFGGHKDNKDGKKGGLLSGLFNKGDNKDGGFLSHIELEDLILIAVIFFLLKDGFEDDIILILAIILFSS